ncbi:MAG: hypothetical protein OEY64_03610 [Nitrospinota bacterium]|nr:hypothetical protein [Nitrospinota bacterium]
MISGPTRTDGLRTYFGNKSDYVRNFFEKVPVLIDSSLGIDIVLAYVFFRLEYGQRLILYSGVRKLHKTNSELTWDAIETHDLKRKDFMNLFKIIYGFPIKKYAKDDLKIAEKFRDYLMHGKDIKTTQMIEAIGRVLDYSSKINEQVDQKCGFKPFSNLRGLTGAGKSLDKSTSRWVLKGMGFNLD